MGVQTSQQGMTDFSRFVIKGGHVLKEVQPCRARFDIRER